MRTVSLIHTCVDMDSSEKDVSETGVEMTALTARPRGRLGGGMRAKVAPCVRGEGRRRRNKKSSQPATSQEAAVRVCAACGAPHFPSSEIITRSNLNLIPEGVPCQCEI